MNTNRASSAPELDICQHLPRSRSNATLSSRINEAWIMRCIFCLKDSASSRSCEHIIPESLGNNSHVLPRGVVCDKCNNYFSREVEKPFLESGAIRAVRFHQALESKKGRVPPLTGVITPGVPALVTRNPRQNLTSVEVPSESLESLMHLKSGRLLLPMSGAAPPGPVVSRFMAKVALEAMADRLVSREGGQDFVCDEHQLDDLRDHARLGRIVRWPTHARRIYAINACTSLDGGPAEQVMHEWDFLVTNQNEWFFVLAIFGLELAINLGGPDIDGYENWLHENNQESPLYRDETPGSYPKPV